MCKILTFSLCPSMITLTANAENINSFGGKNEKTCDDSLIFFTSFGVGGEFGHDTSPRSCGWRLWAKHHGYCGGGWPIWYVRSGRQSRQFGWCFSCPRRTNCFRPHRWCLRQTACSFDWWTSGWPRRWFNPNTSLSRCSWFTEQRWCLGHGHNFNIAGWWVSRKPARWVALC